MSERRLEQLDLNLVLTLHWVLTEQSVSRAAERLGVSQPAVSHGLKRLRDVFGDPLLVKSGKVMRTTQRAERLKPEVALLVSGLRDLFQTETAFDPATAAGRFRVSAPDHWGVLAARAWQRTVARDAPRVSLDVVAIDFPVAQDLISGAVDLAVLPETKVLNLPPGLDIDQFVQRTLCQDDYATGVPESSPLRGRKITLRIFAEADHVLITPAGTSFGIVDELLAERDMERYIAYRTESFLAGAAIARETGCLITAPRSTFAASPDGFEVVPPPLPVQGFAMLHGWHPNWTGDPRHRWLRERLARGLAEVLAGE
jgi:DNA-binding transcriptional LysR family regulator